MDPCCYESQEYLSLVQDIRQPQIDRLVDLSSQAIVARGFGSTPSPRRTYRKLPQHAVLPLQQQQFDDCQPTVRSKSTNFSSHLVSSNLMHSMALLPALSHVHAGLVWCSFGGYHGIRHLH